LPGPGVAVGLAHARAEIHPRSRALLVEAGHEEIALAGDEVVRAVDVEAREQEAGDVIEHRRALQLEAERLAHTRRAPVGADDDAAPHLVAAARVVPADDR